MSTKADTFWRYDLLCLAFSLLFLTSLGLGDRPYLNPSEARYIEIPRQMLVTGDWLTPRINGVPYFEKPPLFFWMQAVVMKFFGTNEWAGRTVSALLSTFTALLTYTCGRMLYGRLAGLLAACILSTSILGFALARMPGLDLPLTFFTTLCLTAFLISPHLAKPRYGYWTMAAASALAVMSKGLVGAVLPGLIIAAWLTHTRKWPTIRRMHLPTSATIFLAIAMPWHLMMQYQHPGFFDFYVMHEHFDRFTTDSHNRTAPWFFFVLIGLAGLMPWLGLLPQSLKNLHPKTNSQNLFLLLWIVIPLIFFSCSHSKLTGYIFPIFPPLSMLLGRTAESLWQMRTPLTRLHYATLFFLLLLAALTCILPYAITLDQTPNAKFTLPRPLPLAPLIPLIIAATLAAALAASRSGRAHIIALAALGAGFGLSLNETIARIETGGTRPLARMLTPVLAKNAEIVAYESYWQDLPIYLNRNITVAGWQGELGYGISVTPKTQSWMISTDTFWKRCAEDPRDVFVFMRKLRYDTLDIPASCPLKPFVSFGQTMLLHKPAAKAAP